MTEERRKLARELLAKATPGPWTHVPARETSDYPAVMPIDAVPDREEDAALIAAAPELLAEALDAIDRLKAEVKEWKRRDDHRYWGVLDY